jgi:2-polyprenyl-3-methyl-5-hydroxy-6-metoxy-1,4-benzoquinol methylase
MVPENETLIEHLQNLQNVERLQTGGADAVRRYAEIHSYRFNRTAHFSKTLVPDPRARVLDIGVSQLTVLLKQYYTRVTTLGWNIADDDGGQRTADVLSLAVSHISFDLNDAEHFERWPDVKEKFDLIVFAETIEHLKIAPEYALAFLGSLLAENGILLVTTPNAATIMKRLILLLKGKNPYGRIRMFSENPGHFREYTMNEMTDIGNRSLLKITHKEFVNMYKSASVAQAFLKRVLPSFRDTLIVAFQRENIK